MDVPCPIEEYDYVATHAEAAVVVAMLNIHATTHAAAPRKPRKCQNGETQAPVHSVEWNSRDLVILPNLLG